VEKYCGARQAIDDNMVHVHFMLAAHDYKNTLKYVLLQQCLHECASVFCYTYIACLVICQFFYAQKNYIIVILILRCFSVIIEMVMVYQI